VNHYLKRERLVVTLRQDETPIANFKYANPDLLARRIDQLNADGHTVIDEDLHCFVDKGSDFQPRIIKGF
jgi:hypothetical protein